MENTTNKINNQKLKKNNHSYEIIQKMKKYKLKIKNN